jgi:hypothetical protein
MHISHKEQELRDALVKRKKRLGSNLVEFFVGCILLVFAFNYLKGHPAERTSIFAGLEVMVQNVEVRLAKMFEGDGEMLSQKKKFQK